MASTKVVTGKARLSYVHLFEKFAFEGQDPKYSTMLLIPKSDTKTLADLRAAEQAAAELGKSSKWGGKIPKSLNSIIRDGDEFKDDYPERGGHWFMVVSSNNKPGVVDANVQPILDEGEVYSGCYARASLNAFPYKFGPNNGVSFGLNHIQKIADGEPLGGITRAEDDFDVVAESGLI
jgi:hypothetical protein